MSTLGKQTVRFSALFLTLSLTLPPPAFALRPEAKAQQTAGLEELEEALRSDDPLRAAAGVLTRQVAQAIGAVPADPAPGQSGGLEEPISVADAIQRIQEAHQRGQIDGYRYVPLYFAPTPHVSQDFTDSEIRTNVSSTVSNPSSEKVRFTIDPDEKIARVERENLSSVNRGVFPADENPWLDTGLEEVQVVFDRLRREAVVSGALAEQGYVELTPEQAARFRVEAVVGGFVVADSAKVTDAGHFIVAEQGLTNEAAQEFFPWISAEDGINGVVDSAKDTEAATGDLLLVKPAAGISVESVRSLLSQRGYLDANAPRVAIGDEGQVGALPAVSFQLLAGQRGVPPVVFLSVAVKLKDEAGNTYTLILMA